MILSDREIRAALARDALKITQLPSDQAWSSTAVDLRLAPELVEQRKPGGSGVEAVICPSHRDYNFDEVRNQYGKALHIDEINGYVFRSGSFLLSWTQERICLPHQSRLAARVELIS